MFVHKNTYEILTDDTIVNVVQLFQDFNQEVMNTVVFRSAIPV